MLTWSHSELAITVAAHSGIRAKTSASAMESPHYIPRSILHSLLCSKMLSENIIMI